MARIRTVKPEFWADEKIARLPRDARLLLIGMFNFADDDGRLRGSPLLIRSQVFPYDSDVDSESLLRALAEASLIVRYESGSEQLIWIRNFNKHQKIDHASKSALPPPPVPTKKSSPKPREDSPKPLALLAEPSTTEGNGSGKGREEEGKGMEILAPPEKPEAPTASVRAAYGSAFEERYRVLPLDNAKTRSQFKRFLGLMPRDEAPLVAAFYLTHNAALYVNSKHCVDLLLRDAGKLHAEWQTGHKVTMTEARQIEKTEANVDGWMALDGRGKHGVV